jgi:hypothetical protein
LEAPERFFGYQGILLFPKAKARIYEYYFFFKGLLKAV